LFGNPSPCHTRSNREGQPDRAKNRHERLNSPLDPQDSSVPFASTEEAWFWFVQAQEARSSGARIVAGRGTVPRPCEPLDMMREVDRLYRQRKLIRDHLHVLVHYGRRLMAPNPERRLEIRASSLWREALAFLDPVLRDKGIVQ
jgi:hypothetical protein